MTKKDMGFPLRMPAEIRTWLQAAADENRRSLNSEIVVRLEAMKVEEDKEKQEKLAKNQPT